MNHKQKGRRRTSGHGARRGRCTSSASARRRPGLSTRAEAAAALGVPATKINRMVEDGAPVAVRGSRGHRARYNIKALRAWKDRRAVSGGLPATLDLAQERARLAAAQAARWEYSNTVRRAQLVEREAAVHEGRAVVAAVRARLLRIPRTAVMRGAVAPENEPALRALVLAAVGEFSKWRSIGDQAGAGA